MPIPRSAILAGPCSVTHRTKTILTQSDVNWRLDYGTFDIESSAQGFISRRADDRIGVVSFTPMGLYDSGDTDGYEAIFHPYAAGTVKSGQKLIGTIMAGDQTLGISTSDDKYFEAQSAVLTRVPDLILSANKMIYGPAEFSCVAADNQAWKTADKFLKIGATGGGNPAFTRTVARSRVITLAYTATWQGLTLYTMDGWNISFDLRITPVTPDATGTIDWLFQDMIVRARCRPILSVGATADADYKTNMLAIEDANIQRGADFADLLGGADDLVITGTDATGATVIVFTLKRAVATSGGYGFAPNDLRPQEVEWVATKTGTDGDALYTIT